MMIDYENAETIYRRFFQSIGTYQCVNNGFRKWRFHCPVHQDDKASALAWLGDDGRIIIGCPVCDTRHHPEVRLAIISQLGLKVSDLMPKEKKWDEKGNLEPTSAWNYRDENGRILYRSARFDLPDGKKRFELQAWNGREFVRGAKGVRRVLYNLPAIVRASKSKTIWLVEGEKKADIMGEVGLVATAVATGSAAPWEPQFTESIRGRPVAIMPDNDGPSKHFAERVAGILMCDGGFDRLAVVPLCGLPAKGDIWDLIRSCKDSEMTKEEISQIIQNALDGSPFRWRRV